MCSYSMERLAISWLSKKHNCVAKSIMEAMYVSSNTTVSNAVWIKRFVDSLNLGIPSRPINVFCDSNPSICYIESKQTHYFKLSLYSRYSGEG